jgi:K+-sensing histidine kinase KdpD
VKPTTKIYLIVLSQIVLIFGSFVSMTILESQESLIGNSVNIAGKNRLLASQFLNEVKDFVYEKDSDATPDKKLNELEKNIILLKNGQNEGDIKIQKLDEQFMNEWNDVFQQFEKLKSEFTVIQENNNDSVFSLSDMSVIENDTFLLISYSDNLVEKIGSSVDKKSQQMMVLQMILLIVNVAVHIGLLLLIFRILERNFEQKVKIEKLATVGELSARLAHDLRNPLSVINVSTQLIKQKTSEKDTAEKLSMIEKGITRMSHQINDVMDFVRTKEPELKLWDLNSILEECFSRFKLPDSVKVTLPKKSILIKCDRSQFEILFINLISNALDSIQNEGSIQVCVNENPHETVIEIIDSGNGIPEDKINRIFEPLTTFKEHGTGLGLASCQNIVKNHRGTISAKNNPTTFTITLPH